MLERIIQDDCVPRMPEGPDAARFKATSSYAYAVTAVRGLSGKRLEQAKLARVVRELLRMRTVPPPHNGACNIHKLGKLH